jgi:hypothetical protein
VDVRQILNGVLILLGAAFLVANLRLLAEYARFRRRRRGALLLWPGPEPPYYAMALEIAGFSWREGERRATLVVISRLRSLARRLIVPLEHYGAARRLLRDKIAAHDIHFTGAGTCSSTMSVKTGNQRPIREASWQHEQRGRVFSRSAW